MGKTEIKVTVVLLNEVNSLHALVNCFDACAIPMVPKYYLKYFRLICHQFDLNL